MLVGRVAKDTAEMSRYVVDLSDWLDDGEVIGSLSRFSLIAADGVPLATAWQTDYPFDPTAVDDLPADATPLILVGSSILGGTQASVIVGAGTPGLTYIVSYIATGSTSGRQREVDFHVTVNEMVNSEMISSLDPTPAVSFTVVAGTTELALGTTGTVFVQNAAAAEITITLPPSPTAGQSLIIVDDSGNAGTFNVHVVGDSGALISGDATYDLAVDNQSVEVQWSGTQWVAM